MQRAATSAGTVSVLSVRRLMDIGVAAGMRRDLLLDALDVAEPDLRDPDARLPLSAHVAAWGAIARYVSDPSFGVRAGATARVRQFGLLGYLTSFSATLRGALRRGERYGRLLTEAVAFHLDEGKRDATLSIRPLAPGPEQPLSQDYALAAWLQVSRELTGVDIVPVAVRFTHAQPSRTLEFRQHFRCPMSFDASSACLIFQTSDLALMIARGDEALAGYLSRYAEEALASLTQGDTWRHAVRAAIWSLLGEGKPSLGRVAAALGIPRRTLQRRLADERTSLRDEVEEIRKTMAVAVLRDPSVSVADASALLGYAEPSVFFRSFRRWTGKTPSAFRQA